MKNSTIYSLFALFFLFSCTYEPEGDFFVEVEPSIPKTTTFQFFQDSQLDFRNYVQLDLRASSADPIVAYELFLNDKLISEGTIPYFISFQSKDFADGVYELTLKLTKRSNSKSLASALELEFYEEVIKKRATIFNGMIPQPKIISIKPVDGVLTVEWEKYEGYAFKRYAISSNSQSQFGFILITDINTTKLEVPDFTGGTYSINLMAVAYNEEYAQTEGSYQYSLNVKIDKTETGVKFSWDHSPFKNYNGVRLYVGRGDGSYDYHYPDKSLNEYFAETSWTFPYYKWMQISALNTVNNSEFYLSSSLFQTKLLNNHPFYSNIKKIAIDNAEAKAFTIFWQGAALGTDILVRHSAHQLTDRELVKKTGIYNISPNAKSIFKFDNNIISKINVETLEPLEEYSISGLVGAYDQFLQIHVSSDQHVLVYVKKGTDNWFYVINWLTKNLVYSGVTRLDYPLTKGGLLSTDGTMFFPDGKSYFISLDGTNRIRSFPSNATIIADKKRIVYFYNGQLVLVNLNISIAHEVIVTLPYTKDVRGIFSNHNNRIGVIYAENGLLNVDFFDSDSLEIVDKLPTNMYSQQSNMYFLVSNTLLVSKIPSWGEQNIFSPEVYELKN